MLTILAVGCLPPACWLAARPGAGGAGTARCRACKRDGTAGLVGWMGQFAAEGGSLQPTSLAACLDRACGAARQPRRPSCPRTVPGTGMLSTIPATVQGRSLAISGHAVRYPDRYPHPYPDGYTGDRVPVGAVF